MATGNESAVLLGLKAAWSDRNSRSTKLPSDRIRCQTEGRDDPGDRVAGFVHLAHSLSRSLIKIGTSIPGLDSGRFQVSHNGGAMYAVARGEVLHGRAVLVRRCKLSNLLIIEPTLGLDIAVNQFEIAESDSPCRDLTGGEV